MHRTRRCTVAVVAVVAGFAACSPSPTAGIRMPDGFATPTAATIVGAPIPLLPTAPSATPRSARQPSGWFALLRLRGDPGVAYREMRRSALRLGVRLPRVGAACRRYPFTVNGAPASAAASRAPSTSSTTTPTAASTRLGPMTCSGGATAHDGRTSVAVDVFCTIGRCRATRYLEVVVRSTRHAQVRVPEIIEDRTPGPEVVDPRPGTRVLAEAPDPECAEGGLTFRELLVDPDTYWRRLEAAGPLRRTPTVRLRFQGRPVRMRFTYNFGGDTAYVLTEGAGLRRPFIVIGGCG